MRKGQLDKDQTTAIVGAGAVAAVERESCEATNRLMSKSDDAVEFSASIEAFDQDGKECTLTAYFYPTRSELSSAGDDLSNVDWKIHGYEIQ